MAENVNRKGQGSVPLKGSRSKGKSEEIAMDDDMTIGAMKDEIIKKLAVERSKGEISMAKTSQSGSKVKERNPSWLKVIRQEEYMETKPVMENEDNIRTLVKRKRGADGELVLAYLSSPEGSSSRLRPRKEVPSFRMVDLNENDDYRIVGKRIKVYWSESRKWFPGHIKAFDDMKRLHSILYDDGDREELDLRKERFELEIMPTEGFSLRVESLSKKRAGRLNSDEAGTIMPQLEKLKVGDTEEVSKSQLKKVRKRGSSKSRRKHTKLRKNLVAKMDLDVVPDNVVEVITNKIRVAEELGELKFDKDSDDSKPLAVIAAQLRLSSEVKKIGSDDDDTEGSEKTESDDCILVKSFERVKKRTKGTTNVKSSELISRKEMNEVETLDADMEDDLCYDDELKKSTVHGDISVEEAVKVSHQKENDKTEVFEEVCESNSGMLHEAQAMTLDHTTEDVKISGDLEGKEKQEEKVEEVISEEIIIQGPRDVVDAMENHNEIKLVLKADGGESFKVSSDLRPVIQENPDEENPEMQQEKLKADNTESEDDVTKKEVDLGSQKTVGIEAESKQLLL